MMRGFVLLVVLVYLQILSLLSMQMMASFISLKREQFHQLVVYQQRQKALDVLATVDQVRQPLCSVKINSALQLSFKSLSWWRQYGCHDTHDNYEYFFVRERLGVDTCSVISHQYKQQLAPVYYRNTLLQISAANEYNRALIVQDTVAMVSEQPPHCSDTLRRVKAGRQALRWL